MRSRHTLPWALGAVALSLGCSALEPREAEVSAGDRCAQLTPYAPSGDAQRFYRYRSHVNMGDPLPRSVSTRRGGAAVQDYIGRRVRTRRHDTGFNPRIVFVVAQFVLLAVAGFVGLVALAMLAEKDKQSARRRNALIALAAFALSLASSYVGGSTVSVDNTSDADLDVTLNGDTYHLPAQSFMNVRVGGFTIDAEARAGGQVIESLTLHPDEGPVDGALRLLWGHGRFIYDVCGRNGYTLGRAHYGR